jgi:eukaryotic-like serine/threonine-protein kinase
MLARSNALATVPRDSDEQRVLLQDRVALFGRATLALLLGFYVLANGIAMVHPQARWVDWVAPFNRLQLATGAAFGTMWLLARGRPRSVAFLQRLEATIVVIASTLLAGIALYSPAVQRPELHVILGITIVLVMRAIVIPSNGRRTAAVSAASVAPAIVAAYLAHASAPRYDFSLPPALYAGLTATWGVLGVASATLASRVIFGLRKKAGDAMRLGQYTLEERIGEGAMGVVYRASHAMLRRPTAVKLLHGATAGEVSISRFEREVQLTSRLTHPNTIAIYDYGRTPEGVFYYAMEFLDGITLEDLGSQFGAQPPERVIHIVRQICASLYEAHRSGLIHRDVKPANVILCERGQVGDVVKVLDFGLVKEVDARQIGGIGGPPAKGEGSEGAARRSGDTQVGSVVGTPLYMAPECIVAPDEIDERSDIYALGCVAYFLLTGTEVFLAETVADVCVRHVSMAPEPPSKRLHEVVADRPVDAVPADLERIILGCLAKRREDRPADAHALSDALAACESAGRWTEARASAWWKEYRARPPVPREGRHPSSMLASTIAVDVASRTKISPG